VLQVLVVGAREGAQGPEEGQSNSDGEQPQHLPRAMPPSNPNESSHPATPKIAERHLPGSPPASAHAVLGVGNQPKPQLSTG
jgi:hypothetical protein